MQHLKARGEVKCMRVHVIHPFESRYKTHRPTALHCLKASKKATTAFAGKNYESLWLIDVLGIRTYCTLPNNSSTIADRHRWCPTWAHETVIATTRFALKPSVRPFRHRRILKSPERDELPWSRWPYSPAGPIYLQSSVSFSGCLSICFPTVSSIWTMGAFTSWYARALIGGLLLCNNWYSVTVFHLVKQLCLTVLPFDLISLKAKFICALCSGNYPDMYI